MDAEQYVLSISYGKDSIACLPAIEILGWPLTRIITADVWATDTIEAAFPEMVEFKRKADAIIKARWGIEVEHVRAEKTAEDEIYHRRSRGNRVGEIMGWPRIKGCDLQRELKVNPIKRLYRQLGDRAVEYIGIAADETKRHGQLSDRKKSPLVELGWTEADCREWCEKNGLLSPIYGMAARDGCWFCPCQPTAQLRRVRHNYPELWKIMLEWDADSPTTFKAGSRGERGRSVHDYDRRFRLEDDGIIEPDDKSFKWEMVDNPPPKQLSLF